MFSKKFVTRCSVCHSAGVLPGRCRADEVVPCPTCKGQGVIEHKTSIKKLDEKPCDNPHCKQGRVTLQTWEDGQAVLKEQACPICDGYGVVYREVIETTKESEHCPTCFGRGAMRADEMRERGIEDFCPICHGKGFIIDKKNAMGLGVFCLFAVFQPAVAVIVGTFLFMLFSVKTVLFSKKKK